MKKLYLSLSSLAMVYSYAQTVSWQRNIASSTQDLLTMMTSTIDRQILLSGSSIQSPSTGNGQSSTNNGYDYHILKLDQQGQKVWDRYFGGSRHDYLMSSVATQEGGFAMIGTSFSNKSGDKKDNNIGGSDVWMLRIDENGNELWQKTLGTKTNDDALQWYNPQIRDFLWQDHLVLIMVSRLSARKMCLSPNWINRDN